MTYHHIRLWWAFPPHQWYLPLEFRRLLEWVLPSTPGPFWVCFLGLMVMCSQIRFMKTLLYKIIVTDRRKLLNGCKEQKSFVHRQSQHHNNYKSSIAVGYYPQSENFKKAKMSCFRYTSFWWSILFFRRVWDKFIAAETVFMVRLFKFFPIDWKKWQTLSKKWLWLAMDVHFHQSRKSIFWIPIHDFIEAG